MAAEASDRGIPLTDVEWREELLLGGPYFGYTFRFRPDGSVIDPSPPMRRFTTAKLLERCPDA